MDVRSTEMTKKSICHVCRRVTKLTSNPFSIDYCSQMNPVKSSLLSTDVHHTEESHFIYFGHSLTKKKVRIYAFLLINQNDKKNVRNLFF